MAEVLSGYGEILIFNDFTGEEAYLPAVDHASATGGLWNIGNGLTLKGYNLADDVATASAVEDGLNGQITLTSSDAGDGEAIYCTTETCFKPSVNAPMAVECRLEMAALTTRQVFVGFSGTVADAQSDICSGATGTLTLTESNICGFLYDVGLTEAVNWYMVYNGGSTTGTTDASDVASGVTPVAGQMDVLRVEVDNNGTARWYINGELLQTVEGAVSTTAVFGGCVGAIATSTASATATVDYFAVEANRDWTI